MPSTAPVACALRLHHLEVAFADRVVVRDVSLDVPGQGLTVLVGRSGSGKTTLLRAMNRLNEAYPQCRTTGQVEADLGAGLVPLYPEAGVAVPPLSSIRRRIGMVFQTPNVLPLSVFRNMALPLEEVAGMRGEALHEAVEGALVRVGLWEAVRTRLDAPAASLSGGQQQRLCLARALALEPSVLLLDEPTASLDAHATRVVEALLVELAQTYPLVLTSHSLGQARRLASRLVVMEEGGVRRVFDEGETPSERELLDWL